MPKKLYVGGLPYSMSDGELSELFSKVGSVESAVIIMDKMSGRSKGFGFVEMGSEEEGQKAIDELNGAMVGERTIRVTEARPQEDRRPGGFRKGNFRQ